MRECKNNVYALKKIPLGCISLAKKFFCTHVQHIKKHFTETINKISLFSSVAFNSVKI